MCECCAHYRAECERLQKRCEALYKALRRAKVFGNRDPNLMWCKLCESFWRPPQSESHAPGCLCAPEAGPEIDAPVFNPPLQPAGNPLATHTTSQAWDCARGKTCQVCDRPAPGEEKSR